MAKSGLPASTREDRMRTVSTLSLTVIVYLLLTGSQCSTETVVTTEVDSAQKISADKGSFSGDLDSGDHWGAAVANIGDLEGDGVIDLAVGAPGDDDGGDNRGALWVLFMNSDGRVDIWTKISDTSGGFTGDLDNNDAFGSAAAGIGDLNGDGFQDIAVGAPFDDDGGDNRGAVWILFMNADGSVAATQKISDEQGGFTGSLDNDDLFGSAVALVGDLDGDGVDELAVGAERANVDGQRKGLVWILFMNGDGTVREQRKISEGEGGFDDSLNVDDRFGGALAGIGDLDNDGIPDLAAGAPGSDRGGNDQGAIWILFLNSNGGVRDERRINAGTGDFQGNIGDGDAFGSAIADIGDLDGDGVDDLAVGAPLADDGGTDRGALWVLFMERNGRVDDQIPVSSTRGKFKENLDNSDSFGSALAGLGNLNNNRGVDIAVGAPLDDDDKSDAGAVYILFMERKVDEKRTGLFD
jgi:hypothetical protein